MAGEMADWGQTAQIVGDGLYKKSFCFKDISCSSGLEVSRTGLGVFSLYKKHCNFSLLPVISKKNYRFDVTAEQQRYGEF